MWVNGERVIASASRSVVFLQGACGFIELKTGRPLRFVVLPDGSPVIGLDGRVVAVNAAVMPDFVGSNLGVPAAEALRLLQLPADATGDLPPDERLAGHIEP